MKQHINVIGFDLDHTLYRGTEETDRLIQEYIYKKIADHRACDLTTSKKLFDDLYQKGHGLSGRKTLVELGVPNATEVVQGALENAGVASTIKKDTELLRLLTTIKQRYNNVDLITGSNKDQTAKKLSALGIPEHIFSHYITDEIAQKGDGTAYAHWMGLYTFTPGEFLYIGDRVEIDHLIPSALGMQTILVNVKKEDVDIKCPQLATIQEIENLLL